MSHLDEGKLHALLDGELDLSEVSEIQVHLGTCAACGARLQEVKQFMSEADRLVGALEIPAGSSRARAEIPGPPARSRPSPPPSRAFREPEVWDTPVLLLPDTTEQSERRRRWMRRFRWAAMIAVVLGAGRLATNALRPSGPLPETESDPIVATSPRSATVSPQELNRPDSARQEVASRQRPEPKPAAPAPARAPAAKAAAPTPQVLADQRTADSAQPTDSLANLASADSFTLEQSTAAADSAVDSTPRPTDSAPAAVRGRTDTVTDDAATRRAAAAALAELDRERRRARAAEATAALAPPRAEVPPPAEAPPPPRTPEQRAQVYLRIGLDEAVKQLGRPVHVIEGMTAEFIGLTQGRQVPGADPARPVVRVVYLDSRGRMILLDQQRMRTGQSAGGAGASLRWSIDDTYLYLHGDPSADVLRNLQRRVR
jgi:anti-sigma factor RsiW